MATVTELIKELRDKTGAGFLDCKKSLEDNNNDIEKSIEDLRKKGLAKASKKSDRVANEGAIGIYSNDNITVILKVNSETDFAAKSDTFLNFLDNLGNLILNHNKKIDKESFLNLKYENGNVQDFFNSMIAKIGENLILNDLIVRENSNIYTNFYIHNSYRINIGKIISLVEYSSNRKDNETEILSKNLCMHIAAMKPKALDISGIDQDLLDKEQRVAREKAIKSGKPAEIIEKMVSGAINKYVKEISLLGQVFVKAEDGKQTVAEYLKSKGATVKAFELYVVGEGMEKKSENFAEEVAATKAASKA